MADQGKVPLDAHAIELVKELAVEASGQSMFGVPITGLGAGLPAEIPVLFDRKQQAARSLKALVEEWRTAPARRSGTARVDTLDAFVDLTNRHKDGQSALFGKTGWPDPKLTAVLNYDSADSEARFGDHRIEYAFPLTEEFKAWVGVNAKPMDQDVFAAFMEEHAAELAAPTEGERAEFERLFKERFATPSEVIELSRHLEVFVGARAKHGVRLQSGERTIEFAEEHHNAKGEPVVIPGIFMVSVAAFVRGDPVRLPARLRYRISGGDIKWFYQLYRWEAYLHEEVRHALLEAGRRTELPAFEGQPEG